MNHQPKTPLPRARAGRVRGVIFLALLLTGLTWPAGAVARLSRLKRTPPPGRLVDVGGYRMHIHCTGQGSPAVILEAGLDDFSIFWSQVQPEVAQLTQVCSYDRAGYGWSDPSPYPRTAETMVKELHTLLAGAGVEGPYVFAGHSFGGALVRLYAHNYPAEVAGMVLVDGVHDELFKRVPVWRKPIEKKLALFRTLAPLSSLGLLAFTPGSIPNRGMPAETLEQYRTIAVSTQYFQTAIAENEAFEDNLAEARAVPADLGGMPLVVISDGLWNPLLGFPGVSEAEVLQAQRAWQEMQAELPALSTNGRQVVAEQSGHYIQFDQPELVIKAIGEMVAGVQK